jgi:hypothetical protein
VRNGPGTPITPVSGVLFRRSCQSTKVLPKREGDRLSTGEEATAQGFRSTRRSGLPGTLVALGLILLPAWCPAWGHLSASETAPPSPRGGGPIEALLGEWSGSGRVLGGDGRLTLRFSRVLNDRFLELHYRAEPQGRPAFEGRAFYRIAGDCVEDGRWFDSNGASYAIRPTCTAESLDTTWEGPSVRGSSRYTAQGASLETTDTVLVPSGEPREFTRATLTRVIRD